MTNQEVRALIDGEREYQDRLWPKPRHTHDYTQYLVYIQDYVREALHLISRFEPSDKVLAIVRKVAAMAQAAQEEQGLSRFTEMPEVLLEIPAHHLEWFLALIDQTASAGLWIATCYKGSKAMLGSSVITPEAAIETIAFHSFRCLMKYGAPPRDIEGDLARRTKQPTGTIYTMAQTPDDDPRGTK